MNDMTIEDAGGNKPLVVPRPISGVREFLPSEQIVVDRFVRIVREEFELAGAAPLQTAGFERVEILTAKEGGDSVDREIYAVTRLNAGSDDPKDADDEPKLALPFDVTVPMARFVAMHQADLIFPFKRYQIQEVYRGERAQAGRFRAFTQADYDILGDGDLSIINDADVVAVINRIFARAKIGRFQIRISDRKLLEGYLTAAGVRSTRVADAMRIVDKIDKVGLDRVRSELQSGIEIDESQADRVIAFVSLRGRPDEVFDRLRQLTEGMTLNDTFERGLRDLQQVAGGVSMMGVPDDSFTIDFSVARGLSYYTGTVYETTLIDHPGIGSICSGGRYDNLAGLFTNRKLPGVGISIGVTRLMSRLLEAGIKKPGAATLAPVLVTSLDRSAMERYLEVAGRLRRAGLGTEVYFETAKIGSQLRYAARKGFRVAIIAGSTELADRNWLLKDLETGVQVPVPDQGIEESVRNVIRQPVD